MTRPLTALLATSLAVGSALAFAPAGASSDADGERPLPAYAADPADATIRPGAGIVDPGGDVADLPFTELDTYCTWNFIFHDVVERDATTGEFPVPKAYIGTAAHCTDAVGQRVAALGADEFGTVVYDSDDIGSQVDFSLVEIDADRVDETHPKMFGTFHGPTGFATAEELAAGDLIAFHGYGLVLGQNDFTRDRIGIVQGINGDDEYVVQSLAQLGDSGSPLLLEATGEAMGIVSRYGFDQLPPSTDVGPLIPWILEHLEDAGFHVELATVPAA